MCALCHLQIALTRAISTALLCAGRNAITAGQQPPAKSCANRCANSCANSTAVCRAQRDRSWATQQHSVAHRPGTRTATAPLAGPSLGHTLLLRRIHLLPVGFAALLPVAPSTGPRLTEAQLTEDLLTEAPLTEAQLTMSMTSPEVVRVRGHEASSRQGLEALDRLRGRLRGLMVLAAARWLGRGLWLHGTGGSRRSRSTRWVRVRALLPALVCFALVPFGFGIICLPWFGFVLVGFFCLPWFGFLWFRLGCFPLPALVWFPLVALGRQWGLGHGLCCDCAGAVRAL